eukprot:5900279-Pyramimonas_sp.AAC.1
MPDTGQLGDHVEGNRAIKPCHAAPPMYEHAVSHCSNSFRQSRDPQVLCNCACGRDRPIESTEYWGGERGNWATMNLRFPPCSYLLARLPFVIGRSTRPAS